ncbi:hypothetical protein [Tessaracoccus caeni]|uniref:hypothetical protein n=1 Tax=Tessaracoccus caeni TaxID=3031239 RepID=UPI0023DB9161|nr:hypothetical protein [Tessaracoccus caeni]MDF1487481.1 hypothetical protein [Tessaracoccus caeni]
MNSDDVTKVLGRVVPDAPSPDAWAGSAIRGARRRRRAGMAAVAALAVLALPVGMLLVQKPPQTAVPATPGGEVTGDVWIFGRADAPELCLEAEPVPNPKSCSGPSLKGDFDWSDVTFAVGGGERAEDLGQVVRWTEQRYRVRGFYDPTDGEYGSFTLTAPVQEAPRAEEPETTHPQLCDDPLAGAPEGVDPEWQQAFAGALEVAERENEIPVVSTWGSGTTYNYLVQGDAEAAFQKLRAEFDGGLCVQSSDAPTWERRREALDAVLAGVAQLPAQYVEGDVSELPPEIEVRVAIDTPDVAAVVGGAAGEVPFRLAPVFLPVTDTSGAATTGPAPWTLDVHQPGEWWTQPLIPVSVVLERCPKPFLASSDPDLSEVTGLPPGSSVEYTFLFDDYHCGIGWSEPEREIQISRDEMTTEAGLRRICSSSGLPMDDTWRYLGHREREWAGERPDPGEPGTIDEEIVTAAFIDDDKTLVSCMAYLWDGHDGGAYVELSAETGAAAWVQACPVEPSGMAMSGEGTLDYYALRGAGAVRDSSGKVLTGATAMRFRLVGDTVATTHPVVEGIVIVDAWVKPEATIALDWENPPPIEGEILGPDGDVLATCRG